MSTVEDDVVQEAPDTGEATEGRAAEQRRIDDEFAAAARERGKIQEQAARLLDAAQRIEQHSRPRVPEADDKPPQRDDHDTYEGYLETTLKHQHKDIQRYVDAQVQAALAVYRESDQQGTLRSKMEESARRGEDAYPGFSGVIEKVPALPQAALSAWQELPEPEHVAHYLGMHQDEAKKIGRMTPARAAHAVIALGERLDQERAGKQSKPDAAEFGPKPGGKPASSGYSPDMNMDSYANARIQEKLRSQGLK